MRKDELIGKLETWLTLSEKGWDDDITQRYKKLGGELRGNFINICLPGDPKAKMRPRFSSKKPKKSYRYVTKVRTYDPQKEEKETEQWQLKARMNDKGPLDGPLILYLLFVMKEPKQKKSMHHLTTPDLDNLIKWVGDVGNGILWNDDRLIVSINARKIYGTEPKTIIIAGKLYGDCSR